MTQTALTPRPASSSQRRLAVHRNGGCEPGRTTSSGCGSKVTTTTGRSVRAAASSARATIRWCPRCTPSNTPTVATQEPQSAGTSSGPCHRCMCCPLQVGGAYGVRALQASHVPASSRSPPGAARGRKGLAGEDRQGLSLAGFLGEQGDQGAVGGEGGDRAGPGAGGRQPAAVADQAGLVGGEVAAGEGGSGGTGDRDD